TAPTPRSVSAPRAGFSALGAARKSLMGQRHPLPYAFAKANTLLLEDDGKQLVLRMADSTPRSALTEVLRRYAVDRFEPEATDTLDKRLAEAYAGGEASAAAGVGEVESAGDLS